MPGKPEPFWRGKTAIYETDDGGAVLAARAEGAAEDERIVIAPAMWPVLRAALTGQPIDLDALPMPMRMAFRVISGLF